MAWEPVLARFSPSPIPASDTEPVSPPVTPLPTEPVSPVPTPAPPPQWEPVQRLVVESRANDEANDRRISRLEERFERLETCVEMELKAMLNVGTDLANLPRSLREEMTLMEERLRTEASKSSDSLQQYCDGRMEAMRRDLDSWLNGEVRSLRSEMRTLDDEWRGKWRQVEDRLELTASEADLRFEKTERHQLNKHIQELFDSLESARARISELFEAVNQGHRQGALASEMDDLRAIVSGMEARVTAQASATSRRAATEALEAGTRRILEESESCSRTICQSLETRLKTDVIQMLNGRQQVVERLQVDIDKLRADLEAMKSSCWVECKQKLMDLEGRQQAEFVEFRQEVEDRFKMLRTIEGDTSQMASQLSFLSEEFRRVHETLARLHQSGLDTEATAKTALARADSASEAMSSAKESFRISLEKFKNEWQSEFSTYQQGASQSTEALRHSLQSLREQLETHSERIVTLMTWQGGVDDTILQHSGELSQLAVKVEEFWVRVVDRVSDSQASTLRTVEGRLLAVREEISREMRSFTDGAILKLRREMGDATGAHIKEAVEGHFQRLSDSMDRLESSLWAKLRQLEESLSNEKKERWELRKMYQVNQSKVDDKLHVLESTQLQMTLRVETLEESVTVLKEQGALEHFRVEEKVELMIKEARHTLVDHATGLVDNALTDIHTTRESLHKESIVLREETEAALKELRTKCSRELDLVQEHITGLLKQHQEQLVRSIAELRAEQETAAVSLEMRLEMQRRTDHAEWLQAVQNYRHEISDLKKSQEEITTLFNGFRQRVADVESDGRHRQTAVDDMALKIAELLRTTSRHMVSLTEIRGLYEDILNKVGQAQRGLHSIQRSFAEFCCAPRTSMDIVVQEGVHVEQAQ